MAIVAGRSAGNRGVVSVDDGTTSPFWVTFADGSVSDWLKLDDLRSSGVSETEFLWIAMAEEGPSAEVSEAAAQLSVGTCGALDTIRSRVARDELPLLSLLQVGPLQVQSSHLSFQEYFAACEISEHWTSLSGTPPWQWPVWWANALTLGIDIGADFRQGLLRSAGVTGSELDLSGNQVSGDPKTVLRVLKELMMALRELSIANNEFIDTATGY